MQSPGTKIRATATVTSKGQVTIPRAVRRALGLETGSQVELEVTAGGRATLAPHLHDITELFNLVPDAKRRRMSLADMERAIAEGARGARR
jgi:AbrB family looped-hinge helix DNA binding protein